jgi:3-hydroxyacyl-[acyl-carrier-protein] dehydratase
MLKDDFFTITACSGEYPSFTVQLALNARHRIFEGHFPGQPVVPGVCLVQMVKEVTETVLGGGAMRLAKAGQIKFIALLDPGKAGILELKLDCERREDGSVGVNAIMRAGKKTCFKFDGVLVQE